MKRAFLYADGAARGNPGPAGAGAALVSEEGHVVAEAMRHLGRATNNVAEYTALIIGLEVARQHDVQDLEIRMDSKLVVEQMNGNWRIKHPNLKPLAIQAGALLGSFPKRQIRHIPRDQNAIADALANRAIDEAS
ncbi:MAG: ribonuclease HI family protein [Chloroflexota bacterium]|nr:ribonuclease HI family protein [Candidatus Limnocylindria bacterium]